MPLRALPTLLRVGLAIASASCVGGVNEPARPGFGPGQQQPGGPGGGPAVPGGTDDASACAAHLPARLVLLSDFQHVSALRKLVSADAITGEDAPSRPLKPFTQKGVVVNTSLVHTRMGWAEDAVAKLKANAKTATGCATIDEPCAERYLRGFAPRAFRRPVDDEELNELLAVYRTAGSKDPVNGLTRAVEAVLSAPSFMYRRELGTPGDDGTLTLDAYELASELSFSLSDEPPDDALWAAAQSGALTEPAELTRQVERLLATRAVQESVTGTMLAAWGLGNVFGAAKDPSLFPEFTPQLQASMYHETELLMQDVLWDRKAPVGTLLSTRDSFVNGSLATLYGLPKPSGDAAQYTSVSLPAQRSGLLTQASVMAMLARSDTTSVVARGIFVRGLLCMSKVPSPPESLASDITALLAEDMTERERAEVRAQNPVCAGCHAGIDPFGLLFENYDALGRYRTTLDGAPIDSHVDVRGDASYAGSHADALAFAGAVAMGDEFSSCMATRVLSYAIQDDTLKPDGCQVQDALAGVDIATLTMPQLVLRVLVSPALRARIKESP